ncbi:hypothetical protein PCAR4_570285 [Paraburkholderia caribensis]|nr:hypothetical protein PCAR4_570285 [Paraburkholderia caribensis]
MADATATTPVFSHATVNLQDASVAWQQQIMPVPAGFPEFSYTEFVSSMSPPDMDSARLQRAFFFPAPPRRTS